MNEPPTGPGMTDWVAAALRSLHPVRWTVGLVGVAFTWLIVPIAEPLFIGSAPDWAGWWTDAAGRARDLGAAIADRSPLAIAIRLGPLLTALIAGWCLVGGWIARQELVIRYRARPGQFDPPESVRGPTGLVVAKVKQLALCPVAVFSLLAVTLFPGLFAGVVNDWFGGVGAIVVAVLLPVVLIANLVLLVLAAGLVAWPLMPAAVAAEQSDVFDALSRAYNYAFERPFRFMLLMTLAAGVAGLPLAVVLGPLADTVRGQPVVVALAAGLSVSIFWSNITLVYLHLRCKVDETDAFELVEPPEPHAEAAVTAAAPEGAPATPDPAKPDPAKPNPAKHQGLVFNFAILPFVYGSWFLTAWLIRRSGGDDGRWLDWGLADGFVPQAGGLRTLAATFGLIWGIAWFVLPIVVAVRPLFKRTASSTESPAA
jgi:hypothetical protein